MSREEYLKYRTEKDQSSILTAYYSHRIGYDISKEDFLQIMGLAIEDDPILKDKITEQYPLILKYFDSMYDVTFLFKDYGPENVILLKAF